MCALSSCRLNIDPQTHIPPKQPLEIHQVPTGRYRFGRDGRNVTGFMSGNRASTDMLSAMSQWSSAQSGREYMVVVDED